MALKSYRATAHWKRIRLQVLRRDGYTCAYCGISPVNQVDHVWPRSRGGEDTLDNLVAACEPCNYAKRDKTDTVFLASTSTPPALRDNISPKFGHLRQNSPGLTTSVRVDADSPFIVSDHKGAS